MAKQRGIPATLASRQEALPTVSYAHQRGVINDNHQHALLGDPLFRSRVEPSKKGKGSYRRHAKHGTRWEPGQQRMVMVCC